MRQRLLVVLLSLALPVELTAQEASVGTGIAAGYGVRADVVYHTASGRELTLDLYVPRGAAGPRPIVVYYHGGGWVIGNRHQSALQLLPYLEKGFIAANVSYRLAETALAPAAVVDAVCALRFVVRNARDLGGDPERVVTTGHSAGGHLAMIVAALPDDASFARECATTSELFGGDLAPARPAAVVNWYGITDVADLLREPNRQGYAETWLGGQLAREEIAKSVSPLEYARAGLPPIITVHGDADGIVPYVHAEWMKEAVDRAGGTYELVTVPGGGHGGFEIGEYARAYDRIWAFLARHRIMD